MSFDLEFLVRPERQDLEARASRGSNNTPSRLHFLSPASTSTEMATLTETDYTKVSTEAAEHLVDTYFSALGGARGTISSFYVPTIVQENGRGLPSITYNGEMLTDATVFQKQWEDHMPRTHFQVQSLNTHVMNPALVPTDSKTKKDAERNMSLIVQVSGSVRLGEAREGPLRGFSDSLVLVPNTEQAGGRGTGKQDYGKRCSSTSTTFGDYFKNVLPDRKPIRITMRCNKPGTDQEVELRVYANGKLCDKYDLVKPSTVGSDTDQCFIPVNPGDQLTIRGTHPGSYLQGSFHVLADGSFLGNKTNDYSKNGTIKVHNKAGIKFESLLNAPKEPSHTSELPPEKVVEGSLHIKDMNDGSETISSSQEAAEIGVGSLAVIVSMSQRAESTYTNDYKNITRGERTVARETVMTGGIPPTYECEFKLTNDNPSKRTQNLLKKHMRQDRFGERPWATLIF
ncbi:hypothetical protein LTR78_010050 [Recurvomyces mirabilis]|uniref:NTF2 domain-containing protein n=1 Tax=Recurvomyces mirabilis TaxID=574656 RepID=A0AAE0TMA7_9PEZI|nr:hypothetical protein LTR78_010050 [Recurvomyces mirabilis]KAK5149831.1 hypothetical protein LTS14_010652 [Recurvomyces mirabilis]